MRWEFAALILLGFCLFLLFFGLNNVGLAGADEPRYAQIAREMLERHDWVTPVLQGKPWLEKPVLYYWEAMLSYRLFGVSDWAARLPGAVDATLLVFGIFLFMRRFCREAALDAALITASSAFLLGFGHAASTDMPLAASFGLGMLAWLAWRLDGRRIWLLGFYLFMALGTLAKGPIAPVLAGVIVSSFALLRREARIVFRTLWWPGLLLYLAVAAPWYILVEHRTGSFFRVFLFEHNLQRFNTPVFHHPQPFWFFVAIALAAVAPWTVLSVAGLIRAVRSIHPSVPNPGTAGTPGPGGGPDDSSATKADISLLLVLWAVLPVLFFSFSKSKLPGYILPCVPALALLAAFQFRTWRRAAEGIPRLVLLLHALLSGALFGGVLLSPHLLLRLPAPRPAMVIAIGAGLMVVVAMLGLVRIRGVGTLRWMTMLPVILGLAFVLRVAAPPLDGNFSARPTAQQLLQQPVHGPVAVFGVEREMEYGLNFYLNRPIANYNRGEIPGGPHLVVTPLPLSRVQEEASGRSVLPLGGTAAPQMRFYWVQ